MSILSLLSKIFNSRVEKKTAKDKEEFSKLVGGTHQASESVVVVLHDGEAIAELSNPRVDPQSEFWCEYDLKVIDQSFSEMKEDENVWYENNLVLQDKSSPQLSLDNYLVNIRSEQSVAIRKLLG